MKTYMVRRQIKIYIEKGGKIYEKETYKKHIRRHKTYTENAHKEKGHTRREDIRHIRAVEIQGKSTYTGRRYTRKEDLYRKGIYTGTYMEKGRHTQKHTQKGDRHKDILGERIYTEKRQTRKRDIHGNIHGEKTYPKQNEKNVGGQSRYPNSLLSSSKTDIC